MIAIEKYIDSNQLIQDIKKEIHTEILESLEKGDLVFWIREEVIKAYKEMNLSKEENADQLARIIINLVFTAIQDL